MPKHRYPAEKYHALGSFPTSRNSTFFTAFTNFLRAGNKKSSLLSGTSGLVKHCSDEGKWDWNLKYKGSIEFAPSQFTKKIERSSVKNCFSTTLSWPFAYQKVPWQTVLLLQLGNCAQEIRIQSYHKGPIEQLIWISSTSLTQEEKKILLSPSPSGFVWDKICFQKTSGVFKAERI